MSKFSRNAPNGSGMAPEYEHIIYIYSFEAHNPLVPLIREKQGKYTVTARPKNSVTTFPANNYDRYS